MKGPAVLVEGDHTVVLGVLFGDAEAYKAVGVENVDKGSMAFDKHCTLLNQPLQPCNLHAAIVQQPCKLHVAIVWQLYNGHASSMQPSYSFHMAAIVWLSHVIYARSIEVHMPIGCKPTLHAGYYGNLGTYIIGSCLTLIIGRTVIEIKDTPLAGLMFQQFFLLPWVATRLISEDLGLDFDQAHKAMMNNRIGPNLQLYSLTIFPILVYPWATIIQEMTSSAANLQLMHPAQCRTWQVLDWPVDDWKKWGSSWREIDTRYPSGPLKHLPHPSPNSMQWYDHLCITV
ncbi:hypothetical protein FA15DRAFT_662163 [Coprinopsis marcescibilis]|uniref:Uncharacterized protein n=1 Tax=Coprinopsis marcescibilis TaxID=230819 RepID=A0A5C3K8Q8_COPMA|nr:hypothetical protein FA15DRAFT_662163 [Coprinopsis marcescibilis]